jgi:hypothetical protein
MTPRPTNATFAIRVSYIPPHTAHFVIRGLDPRIHAEVPHGNAVAVVAKLAASMDCRVKLTAGPATSGNSASRA